MLRYLLLTAVATKLQPDVVAETNSEKISQVLKRISVKEEGVVDIREGFIDISELTGVLRLLHMVSQSQLNAT